jgi:large conductance mechanosensitive channel
MTSHSEKQKTVSTEPATAHPLPDQEHGRFEVQELHVVKPLQGFIDFVREQGVVGLGVGFVVGTAASTLVKSIVANIFNPLIGLAIGGDNLAQKSICLKQGAKACANSLSYGQVLSDLITFILILFLVYFLIRGMKLEKIDRKKDKGGK